MRRRTMLLLVVMGAALVLSSGVALAVTRQCEESRGGYATECYGTKGPDTLRGTAEADYIYGRGDNDTLTGFGGSDKLYGQGGKDKLLGGPDEDYLYGGRGNDTLDGGQGEDYYYLDTGGWGKDRIIDTSVSDSDPWTGNSVYSSVHIIESLVIDLTSDSGPKPEVKNTSGTSSINWDGNVIDNVSTGRGNDTIKGNSGANRIYAYRGTDTVVAGDGDDHIDVTEAYTKYGSGVDTVECGEGNDTVRREPPDPATGDPGDAIAADCENQLDPYNH